MQLFWVDIKPEALTLLGYRNIRSIITMTGNPSPGMNAPANKHGTVGGFHTYIFKNQTICVTIQMRKCMMQTLA